MQLLSLYCIVISSAALHCQARLSLLKTFVEPRLAGVYREVNYGSVDRNACNLLRCSCGSVCKCGRLTERGGGLELWLNATACRGQRRLLTQ